MIFLAPESMPFLPQLRELAGKGTPSIDNNCNLYTILTMCQALFQAPYTYIGFSGGSVLKNPLANAEDLGSIPGWGRSPREGNGNPLGYSWLENSIDRGHWQAIVHGVTRVQYDLATKLRTTTISDTSWLLGYTYP